MATSFANLLRGKPPIPPPSPPSNSQTSADFRNAPIPQFAEESTDCFGIDFGNSNICVSYYQNQQFRVVQLEAKTTTMPANITFKDDDLFVGNDAKNTQTKKATKLTLFDFRKLITSNDNSYQALPFAISKDLVFSSFTDQSETFPLIRAVAVLFHWIKNKIKSELQLEMNKIVLTVPSGFNLTQRQFIVDAARIIGLKVMHILHEPTAAAITYFVAKPEKDKTICVFDFGSAKLDIALVRIDDNGIKLLESKCNLQLGGRDFDECLFNRVHDQIKKKHLELTLTQMHLTKIREECIKAKLNLSASHDTNIEVDIAGHDINIHMTSSEYESLCNDLFKQIEDLVKQISQNNNQKVSDVLLIGGSSRMKRVQDILLKAFPDSRINQTINGDEAVAKGAAIYATSLAGLIKKLNIVDLVPWDGQEINRAAKMEYFVDDYNVVQKKIYSPASQNGLNIAHEFSEVANIFAKKTGKNPKQLQRALTDATKKSTRPLILDDAINVLNRAQNKTLLNISKNLGFDITQYVGEYAGIQRHMSNFESYNDNNSLNKLRERIPRINIFLDFLELLNSTKETDYAMETRELEKMVYHLYDKTSLTMDDTTLQYFTVYLQSFNYWLSVNQQIREFQNKNLKNDKVKTILTNLQKKTNSLKSALDKSQISREVLENYQRYIGSLTQQFWQLNPQ